MSENSELEFIRSQLTTARWHLERAGSATGVEASDHLNGAGHAYRASVDLLPTLKLLGTRRVELLTELADVRNRLRALGVEV